MTAYRHYGKVVNHKPIFKDEAFYQKNIDALEGKEFEIVMKEKHKKVSEDTHAYYRAGIIEECLKYEIFGGWNKEEVHAHFARMFLSYLVEEKHLVDGEVLFLTVKKTESTADITQKEMNEFVDNVIQWCAEQGIVILSPEQYYLKKHR
jgi:hypothetical protein